MKTLSNALWIALASLVCLLSKARATPDLIVEGFDVIEYPVFQNDGTFHMVYGYAIRNVGTSPASLNGPTASELDNVYLQAYASSDRTVSAGDQLAGGGPVPGGIVLQVVFILECLSPMCVLFPEPTTICCFRWIGSMC